MLVIFASAFNKTMEKLAKTGLSLKNFTYTNKKIADDIYEAINSTSFLGVSVSQFYFMVILPHFNEDFRIPNYLLFDTLTLPNIFRFD